MKHVKVGGVWKDVRGLWVNIGGVWKPTIGTYCNIGGVWKKEVQVPFYNLGTENLPYVAGYSNGQGSISKQPDHLYVYAGGGATTDSQKTYVSNIAVSLLNINTIYIDWKSEGVGQEPNITVALCISTVKNGVFGTYNATIYKKGAFARTVDSVNVSSLTGSYYLRIHAAIAWNDSTSLIRVYKIWGQ